MYFIEDGKGEAMRFIFTSFFILSALLMAIPAFSQDNDIGRYQIFTVNDSVKCTILLDTKTGTAWKLEKYDVVNSNTGEVNQSYEVYFEEISKEATYIYVYPIPYKAPVTKSLNRFQKSNEE